MGFGGKQGFVKAAVFGPVSIPCSQAAFIVQVSPNTNQEPNSVVEVQNITSTAERGLIDFILPTPPAGASVQKAELVLRNEQANVPFGHDPSEYTVRIHQLTASWVAAEVTWNNRASGTPWTTAGGDYSAPHTDYAPQDSAGNTRRIDITSLVTWAGLAVLRLLLRFSTEDSLPATITYQVDGDDSPAYDIPRLELTYIS